ncbi:ABC transporter substrate-binding protein [Erythrobacter alti]|uniref:ABC transporter substrate-binding protein n=1 Tax=Erythrobacter alti TaxID=1896145 RepID=UPI0030F45C03
MLGATRTLNTRVLALILGFTLLGGCGSGNDGTLEVALIGSEDVVFSDGIRLSAGAQYVRAATDSGLVSLNENGDVIPALAETWLPTEDGLSFIFRLRSTTWPDGTTLTAESASEALMEAIERLDGTSLGQDLAVIEEVRAMGGRVIEIRLFTPEPYLLQLLAQPELALRTARGGTGPMVLTRGVLSEDGSDRGMAWLNFKPPPERGLPEREDWEEDVRQVELAVVNADEAIRLFNAGEVELVLGGDLGSLPLVDTGPLATGTLRVDPVIGLFGLQVRTGVGMLSNAGVREGIAMAIDRAALLSPYNVGGWERTTRPVAPDLPGDPGLVAERWNGEAIDSRRSEAAARIGAWRRQFDQGDLAQPVAVSLFMQEGPGWDLFQQNLAAQLANINIRLERAQSLAQADLVVVDRVARFPAPHWFLNQFNCSLRRGLCSEEVDRLVAQALAQTDPAVRATMMAQAEAELTLENIYIPIGSPLRWSLLRGSVDGFEPNAYAFHPLPPMAQIPR